jgi:hypothetical protein
MQTVPSRVNPVNAVGANVGMMPAAACRSRLLPDRHAWQAQLIAGPSTGSWIRAVLAWVYAQPGPRSRTVNCCNDAGAADG